MDEQYNVNHENKSRKDTTLFPCPSCGGNMDFSPESQSLLCPYCKSSMDIPKQDGDIIEHDFDTAEDKYSENWGDEKAIIHCINCGADTVLDSFTTAASCAFCGSSHVVKAEDSKSILPESLIPFKFSKNKALEYFKEWIKKRYFAPGALKNEYNIHGINGVYIPSWTYDSDTYSYYTAEAGTYYYETETRWVEENGERRMVTEQVRKIRWWPTSGTYSVSFDDVLVNASKQIDENIMKKLEPFNLDELVNYKPEFLSGFMAERYSIGLDEGWQNAKYQIDPSIHSGVIRDIGADEVRNLNINTNYFNIKYKHILLPVWISSYTYKDKVFRYMINGQTGEVQGNAPISGWKVFLTILSIVGLIALVIVLIEIYGS